MTSTTNQSHVNGRPNRTRAQTLAHLEERRRLAASEHGITAERLEALDRSIAALTTGAKIPACSLEDHPVDETGDACTTACSTPATPPPRVQ